LGHGSSLGLPQLAEGALGLPTLPGCDWEEQTGAFAAIRATSHDALASEIPPGHPEAATASREPSKRPGETLGARTASLSPTRQVCPLQAPVCPIPEGQQSASTTVLC
jgi:hypothetical protein